MREQYEKRGGRGVVCVLLAFLLEAILLERANVAAGAVSAVEGKAPGKKEQEKSVATRDFDAYKLKVTRERTVSLGFVPRTRTIKAQGARIGTFGGGSFLRGR